MPATKGPAPHALEAARAASLWAGMHRRKKFLDQMLKTGNIHDACEAAEVALGTYHKWRVRHPEFAAQVDAARAGVTQKGLMYHGWKGTFATHAKEYFKHEFSWFHLMAAEAFDSAEGGDIIMFLWPPEHGKTTLTEDYDNYKLATDPSYRISVGSETKDLAEKIVSRVRSRMEADGPTPAYVRRFGPFAPVSGKARSSRQPWANDHFSVYKKGSFDERDFSMQALGAGGSIIGTRCDLLQVDDLQSSKNATAAKTETLLNVFRGDWLSRPGTKGHTVVNGSRQSNEDVLKAIQDEGLVDRLIKLPAYDESRIETHGTPWLWPEYYSERDYERLKRNAGAERWDLTYLQKDTDKANLTFTPEIIGKTFNAMRSVIHDPPAEATMILVGLDPAIGSPNGVIAAAATWKKLWILRARSVPGLTNNSQVLGLVEEFAHQFNLPGRCQVTDVIIESKAYQKALMDDHQLHELVERFGFRVYPHDTGLNKYDENLGVPQMVHSMLRGEIDMPWSDDGPTRKEMQQLVDELKKWKPHVRGTRLRMDVVMALWFVWMKWRTLRGRLKAEQDAASQFQTTKMPFKPTRLASVTAFPR